MASNSINKLPRGVELHGKYLRISFTYKGSRRRESLKLEPTKQNIKFAKSKLDAIKYEVLAGSFNYSHHFPDSNVTIGKPSHKPIVSLINQYLKVKEQQIRRSTFDKYVSMLNIFSELYGKERSSETINPRSISEVRTLLIQGRTAKTANTYLSTVRTFFTWLHAMEYLDRNYLEFLSNVKVPEREIEPFTIAEFKVAIDACLQEQHKNIITLLAYSGLRTGEMCALSWEDINFEERTMLIRRSTFDKRGLKTTKTDKERTVDILPPACDALEAQFKLTGHYEAKEHPVELADKTNRIESLRFVFSPHAITGIYSNRPYDYLGKTVTNKMWQSISLRAGIKYRTVYQFRHTYASWMLSAGVNMAYLAEQMGHANFLMIAQVYGKWMNNPNQKESDKAWKALEKRHNPVSNN